MSDFRATMSVLASEDFAGDRTGSQVYVSRYGVSLLDVAVGARSRTSAMSTQTLLRWVCCAKPLVLVAFLQELADARLDESARVADTIPEYAVGGEVVGCRREPPHAHGALLRGRPALAGGRDA